MRRISVIGNGVAGKLFAKLASMLPSVERVTVLEASAGNAESKLTEEMFHSFYTGLWSPSLRCISKYLSKEVSLSNLFQNGTMVPVGHSGYRSVSGQWLMTPYSPMNTDSNRCKYINGQVNVY